MTKIEIDNSIKTAKSALISKLTVLLDSGHGGVIDGIYQTSGKRSYFDKDGKLLPLSLGLTYLEKNARYKCYEGEMVRDVVKRVKRLCLQQYIHFVDVVDSDKDVSLSGRVKLANDIKKTYPDRQYLYVSIHMDAFDKESANGWSCYTSIGQTKSDPIASMLYEEMKKLFSNVTFREDGSDGDPDKEENFFVVKNTNMPAILSENFFYTNWKNFSEIINTEDGREKIATAHVNLFKRLQQKGFPK